MKLRKSTLELPETSATIDSVDHTKRHRSNIAHEMQKRTLMESTPQTQDTQKVNTDFDHTQRIEPSQTEETQNLPSAKMKEPTTPPSTNETTVTESPASFFIRFFGPKIENPYKPDNIVHANLNTLRCIIERNG